jgi:hypothetical protein
MPTAADLAAAIPQRIPTVLRKPVSAGDLLARDRAETLALFDRLDKAAPRAHAAKARLLDAIYARLNRVALAEEQILYPAARQAGPDTADALAEATVERAAASMLSERLNMLAPDDALFGPTVQALRLLTERHDPAKLIDAIANASSLAIDLIALGDDIASRWQLSSPR